MECFAAAIIMQRQSQVPTYTFTKESLTNDECCQLIHGYTRLYFEERSIPSEIIRLCVSFYSIWFDLKIVYCDDTTGEIDLTKYQIKAIPMDSNPTLREIGDEMEDDMFRQAVANTRNLSRKQLMKKLKKVLEIHPLCAYQTKEELIRHAMSVQFGRDVDWDTAGRDKIRWDSGHGTLETKPWYHRFYSKARLNRIPLVHVWLKFKQIKNIYPVKTKTINLDKALYDNEDDDRWVEVPDDLKITLSDIRAFDKKEDWVVIEQCNVSDWRRRHTWHRPICTWPRQKGNDWRETLQVGDIVEVRDEYGDFDSLIRYVYPKDHETMSGKCVVHYIGWEDTYDEVLDINSDRIMRRYTNCKGQYEIKCPPTLDDFYARYVKNEQRRKRPQSNDEGIHFSMDAEESTNVETYESQKYARNHKAKRIYPKKKAFRKNLRKYGVKSGNKRIENKMKKYKIRQGCLAY